MIEDGRVRLMSKCDCLVCYECVNADTRGQPSGTEHSKMVPTNASQKPVAYKENIHADKITYSDRVGLGHGETSGNEVLLLGTLKDGRNNLDNI